LDNSKDGRKAFVLPRTVSLHEYSDFLKKIKDAKKGARIEIDFGNVEDLGAAGTVFLAYLKARHPNVEVTGLRDGWIISADGISLDGSAADLRPSGVSQGARLENLADKFVNLLKNLRRFFALLTDEIYYTLQSVWSRKGTYRGQILQQLFFMGYKSFPIVVLISFLVGVTISLMTADQLKLFGADIYLADFIGIAMLRELVPLMTGIILAGKIGASIAAEISTMNVMEEIDALKTMGIIPVKFLMAPRLMAITLAVPLLVALGDFAGIFGGILVGRFHLGTPLGSFLREMLTAVNLRDLLTGVGKTLVFGWAIVISSGYKGFFARRGAEDVGVATTEAVVLSISLIILLDCLFAFVL